MVRPDVCTAVGQPGDRVVGHEHLAHRLQRAVAVVLEGVVEEGTTVVTGHEVVGELVRVAPVATSACCDRIGGIGLVLGWVTELEGPLEGAIEEAAEAFVGPLGEQAVAHVGPCQRGEPLVEREGGELAPRGVRHERVQRRREAEEHTDRPAADLRAHPVASGVDVVHHVEQLAPQVRSLVDLDE